MQQSTDILTEFCEMNIFLILKDNTYSDQAVQDRLGELSLHMPHDMHRHILQHKQSTSYYSTI